MELNSSLSSPRPPQQLYSPHALGSCSACCLGYFCHLHFTFTSYSRQPPLSASLWKKAGTVIYCIYAMFSHQWQFNIWTNYSPNCTNSNGFQVASGPVFFIFITELFSPSYPPSDCLIFSSHVYVSPSSLVHNLIWVVIIFSCDIYWSLQPCRSQRLKLKVAQADWGRPILSPHCTPHVN